jgi:hypothetical protein
LEWKRKIVWFGIRLVSQHWNRLSTSSFPWLGIPKTDFRFNLIVSILNIAKVVCHLTSTESTDPTLQSGSFLKAFPVPMITSDKARYSCGQCFVQHETLIRLRIHITTHWMESKDWSDEGENANDSIRVNGECDSNNIDENEL